MFERYNTETTIPHSVFDKPIGSLAKTRVIVLKKYPFLLHKYNITVSERKKHHEYASRKLNKRF